MGPPVADPVRPLGISEQAYRRWKRKFAGLESDQVREPSFKSGPRSFLVHLAKAVQWVPANAAHSKKGARVASLMRGAAFEDVAGLRVPLLGQVGGLNRLIDRRNCGRRSVGSGTFAASNLRARLREIGTEMHRDLRPTPLANVFRTPIRRRDNAVGQPNSTFCYPETGLK